MSHFTTTIESMSQRMKVTPSNIIALWFGADTPLRQYKIQANPKLWAACLQVNDEFSPPSGAVSLNDYRKSDRLAFAKAVEHYLTQTIAMIDVEHEYA